MHSQGPLTEMENEFAEDGKYKFPNHEKKALFTLHAKQRRPFTLYEKGIGGSQTTMYFFIYVSLKLIFATYMYFFIYVSLKLIFATF